MIYFLDLFQIEMTLEDEVWLDKLLDPEFDANAASSKRREPDLHLHNIDSKQIGEFSFTSFKSYSFFLFIKFIVI